MGPLQEGRHGDSNGTRTEQLQAIEFPHCCSGMRRPWRPLEVVKIVGSRSRRRRVTGNNRTCVAARQATRIVTVPSFYCAVDEKRETDVATPTSTSVESLGGGGRTGIEARRLESLSPFRRGIYATLAAAASASAGECDADAQNGHVRTRQATQCMAFLADRVPKLRWVKGAHESPNREAQCG